MSVLLHVRAALNASPAVSGVVAGRIHPVELPQAPTLPALVLTPVRTEDERHLSGHNRLPVTEVIIDVVARTWAEADSLAEDVKSALQDYRGEPIDDIASTSLDFTDRGQAGDLYRRRMGFDVRWRQT